MRLAGILIVAVSLSLVAGQSETPQKKASAAKADGARAVSSKRNALALPAEAVEVSAGRWRYVDKAGKTWVYTYSPVGLMRTEVSAEWQPTPAAGGVRAFDEGDSVRFEKSLPMGVSKWRKKKSEMNDMERSIWEREKRVAEQANTPPAEPAKQE